MKRILFIIQEYTQGGINKCLENMLGILDNAKYDIYIYSLYEDGGDYYKNVFSERNVKKGTLYLYAHDNKYTRKIMGLYNKLTKRLNFSWLYRYEAKRLQSKYNFDIIVAYHEGMTVEFASYFNKPKKMTWMHCDPMILGKSIIDDYGKYYLKMNDVICVSSVVKESYIKLMPDNISNIHVIHNLLDMSFVRSKASERDVEYQDDKFRIISVGRSTKVKQFELIPTIVRHILDVNPDVKLQWDIISSGHECDDDIRKAVINNNVGDYVKMLGEKTNPYPYVKSSNLLVSTSYSEAYPTVINEAQTLGVPVVANNYPSAPEIISEKCGIICSIEDMPEQLCNLIENKDGIYESLLKNVSCFEYHNSSIIQQLNHLFA